MITIVPAEKSSLRLSEQGIWHHEGEAFENEKVIDFFHKAIHKDRDGRYFLRNAYSGKEEHVYFQVDDTAYFVCGIHLDEDTQTFWLKLNNGVREPLKLDTLEEDSRGVMYCRVLDNDRARINPTALVQLSDYAVMDEESIHIEVSGKKVVLSKV